MKTWSGSQSFAFARVHRPRSLSDVVAAVRGARHVKAVGSLHSFNESAAAPTSDADLILLSELAAANPPVLDTATATVSVSAGATYGDLCMFLAPTAFALHNLASLPHISVGGAIGSATHGSGIRNQNLAGAVVGRELVDASGEVHLLTRRSHPDTFDGCVVHLGALGVVTRVTLALVPRFELRQDCYEGLTFEAALAGDDGGAASLADLMGAGYSVSLFTTWREPCFEQVWRKILPSECEGNNGDGLAPDYFHGAVRAIAKLHPIKSVSADACTEQLGQAGPWHERLAHFRYEFQPSVGNELQSEFFVSRDDAPAAIRAVSALREMVSPLLYISELRAIAADSLWLSASHERDSIAFHFTWRFLPAEVAALLPVLEAALAPFVVRPHFGKLFAMSAEDLNVRFPRLRDFVRLRRAFDPHGKFLNNWLRKLGLE